MRSMTGYGEASYEKENLLVRVECRSVNHRFFSLKLNLPETLTSYESEIESLVQKFIHRGTINLNVKLTALPEQGMYQFNATLIRHYYRRLKGLQKSLGIKEGIILDTLLTLPGVLEPDAQPDWHTQKIWLKVKGAIQLALRRLQWMREREGKRLHTGLKKTLHKMQSLISQIESYAPVVIDHYEQNLRQRVARLLNLKKNDLKDNQSLATEIMLFAQRCQITEEIQRLLSHLNEFTRTMNDQNAVGKKLDFITQEMLRETNTIASKANNARIAHWAIELKTETEKIKEQIQNIE